MSDILSARGRALNEHPVKAAPVFYWMDRDQRADDNWALLAAMELARSTDQPLAVVFNLENGFLGGGNRQHNFKVRGLKETAGTLEGYNIPFYLVAGENTGQRLITFFQQHTPGAVITDFSPLKIQRQWKSRLAEVLDCALYEVDTHNIVPCWLASDKQEHAAWTLRRKLTPLLDDYLTEFPRLARIDQRWPYRVPAIDWQLHLNSEAGHPFTPGTNAAYTCLQQFLEQLDHYSRFADDANRQGQSHLSPYFHFGQLAPHRAALEVKKQPDTVEKAKQAYIEQLAVRRELAENFCYFNPDYDAFSGFPEWAQRTLNDHRNDPRTYLYEYSQFENGETHDPLWNAAQLDMVRNGKMPGYLRMYWAKKILEWTSSPEKALDIAIKLNDRYEIDGRDPNGYVGIAWSIGGVHDHPWKERPIYGKVRYMTENACKKRFDVKRYIHSVLKE